MKVYTHYLTAGNGEGFRWRTLLQFGNSWEVIGTVVMKNPGTANFRDDHPISNERLLSKLKIFDDSADCWYEFNSDSTMDCVSRLFAFYYDKTVEQLNGVIQLFNLFYVKEGNLREALKKDSQCESMNLFDSEEEMTVYDVLHLVPPVYLGFGSLATHKKYRTRAEKFFHAATEIHHMSYLNPIFERNAFTHPQYLMAYGKNRPASILLRQQFKQNTCTPTGTDKLPLLRKELSNAEKLKIVALCNESMQELGCILYDKKRFRLNEEMGISILTDGTVGYRHIAFRKNYEQAAYPHTEEMRTLLDAKGFRTDPATTHLAWIGKKPFSRYGEEVETISRSIVKEVQDVIEAYKGFLEDEIG